MVNTSIPTNSSETTSDRAEILRQFSSEEIAQALLEKLAITDRDWHRLKSNRKARASEQIAAALVFLLKNQPEESLPRLQQAIGWLDRSVSAPPCPTHGDRGKPSD
jgi:hypothetical protein